MQEPLIPRKHRTIVAALMLAAGLLWLLRALLLAPNLDAERSEYPRLESALRELVEARGDGGAPIAAELAARHGVSMIEGRVRVVVVEQAGHAAIVQRIAALGGQIETGNGPWTQALVPLEALPDLANTPGLLFVRRPWQPLPLTSSEGVTLTLAHAWPGAGLGGQGVKVGVLDVGFLGYTNRINEGELPSGVITKSFVGDGSELDFWGHPATQHGTACAEVVHDMAPAAQLYLVNAGTEVEWSDAVDWLLAQEVDVISFSAGWPLGGPGDGTGTLSEKVSELVGDGVLWVNAAGNNARRHWMGLWNGPHSGGWHSFGPTDETNEITVTGGLQIQIGLRWDDSWGASDNDYDLFLFDSSLKEVARSENIQDGDDDPLEIIAYSVPAFGVYHVAIAKQSGAQTRTLELFSYYHDFHYQTISSSLVVPADSPGSLTVGATYWQDDALEDFSSQGPTRDGRIKPDLAAPDGVSVSAEPYSDGFYGTSASAPHVAGAAALVLDAFPTFSPTQTLNWLQDRAIDLGAAGTDNAYGAGRLNLGDPPLTVQRLEPPAALQGQTVTLSIIGSAFSPTATFCLSRSGEPSLTPLDTKWISPTRLTGTLNLGSAARGFWSALVTHSTAVSATLPNAFLVAMAQVYLPLITKNVYP
ncbi:MAG: hypothetical protein B6I34_03935 [Anaerolineaceae bacterium 4572_32.1]|nr:MAG: hypothetical protein B6I34_03935 [Anaerolineaceae bacterium 4572_32.1]